MKHICHRKDKYFLIINIDRIISEKKSHKFMENVAKFADFAFFLYLTLTVSKVIGEIHGYPSMKA